LLDRDSRGRRSRLRRHRPGLRAATYRGQFDSGRSFAVQLGLA